MKLEYCTLNRADLDTFEGKAPADVVGNCGKEGFYVLGGKDREGNLIGMTEFYVGMTSEGEICADIVYVYVKEEKQRKGVASKMIARVHSILKKSNVKRCLVFLKKGQGLSTFFKNNGYLFTRDDPVLDGYLQTNHPESYTGGLRQGFFPVG